MATAVVCSDEFGPLGRAEAEVLGAPGLPLVPIPHPLADNRPELVRAKADAIVDEVVAALTGDAAEVAERHRHRFVRLTQRRLAGGELCLDDACAIDLALTPAAD
ncbi:MAG: hypothetical protein OEV40_22060 [Acidimicrobiia bacterium]|nr:hypothetical protein [Acidimicrobiia bacterium]